MVDDFLNLIKDSNFHIQYSQKKKKAEKYKEKSCSSVYPKLLDAPFLEKKKKKSCNQKKRNDTLHKEYKFTNWINDLSNN